MLLAEAGFDIKVVPEAHLCCGSAGTYNLLQPVLATQLRDRKLANIARTGATVVAAGNIGCIQQIAAGQLPVVHTVELLDWATAWKRGDKNALLEFYASSASPSVSEKLIDSFSVINSQPEFYSYPGETDHLLAVFRIQATTGPVQILEQHWKRQSSNWKIVLETQVDLL